MSELTSKQETVMGYKAQGFTNKEIAKKLNLSEPAIQLRVNNAVTSLGARNPMHAVSVYVGRQYTKAPQPNLSKTEVDLSILELLQQTEKQIAELGLEPLAAAKRLELLGVNTLDEFLYDERIMEYVTSMLSLIAGVKRGE